jgi:hypothetical protein
MLHITSSRGAVAIPITRQNLWRLALVGLVTSLVAVLLPGTAWSQTVPCLAPTVVDDSTHPGGYTFQASMGPCSNGGLIVLASGDSTDPYVIDLNGYDLFGTSSTGDSAGIHIYGSYVHVTNSSSSTSTIHSFDGGVVIGSQTRVLGEPTASHNRVEKIVIKDNIGSPSTTWGEGVSIWNATHNSVCNNVIRHNGPYAGVGIYGRGSEGNKVGDTDCGSVTPTRGVGTGGNDILNNDVPLANRNEDIGVRLEPGTVGTTVENNLVKGSGLDGISVFRSPAPFTRDHVIKNNTVRDNGCHEYVGSASAADTDPRAGQPAANATCGSGTGTEWFQFAHRKGDGIRIHGAPPPVSGTHQNAVNNTVQGNTVCGSAASGIRVDGGDFDGPNDQPNTIKGNTSSGPTDCPLNVRVSDPLNKSYDLYDVTYAFRLDCLGNAWGSPSNTTATTGTRYPSTSNSPAQNCTIS